MNSKFLLLILCLVLCSACSKDNEKTIYVADTTVNCSGMVSQRCLQIKENEKDNWSNHFGEIEGFEYEKGYSYKLKVEISKIEGLSADVPSEKYILMEVLEKTKTPPSLAKGSWLVVKIKDKTSFDRNPVITLTPSQNQIQGSTSCNKFFGNIDLQDSNFKVNTIGSTKMMCQNMDTEHLFLDTLNQVVKYRIENDQLNLIAADKTVVMICDYLIERE